MMGLFVSRFCMWGCLSQQLAAKDGSAKQQEKPSVKIFDTFLCTSFV